MRGWWRDLADLVLPAECGGCGTSRTVLCENCRTALSGAVPSRVRPDPEPPGLPMVYAAAPYTDAVRAAILAHKERGVLALVGPLGAALAGAVRAGLRETRPFGAAAGRAGGSDGPVLLVPLPSARWISRSRGHDPVRRIALAAAGALRRSGTPARMAAVLRQRRDVADQSGLDARQRLSNLAGALETAAGSDRLLRGCRVVLVDDLMTTGASLTEAQRAVRVTVGYESGTTPVYGRVTREGRDEQTAGPQQRARQDRQERTGGVHDAPGMTGANAAGRLICAAVIAAPPDSFEINRN